MQSKIKRIILPYMIAMAASQNGMMSNRFFDEPKSIEDIIEENRVKGKKATYQPKILKKHQKLGVRKLSKSKRSKSK